MFKTIFYGVFLTVFVSLSIITMASVAGNIDMHGNLPIKASYFDLSKEARKQVTCLAENIYFEAANEPYKGKKAVAFVTINRLQTGNYAGDICGVVYQKTNGTCQFSWYCDKTIAAKRLTIKHTEVYNEILELAVYVFLNFDKLEDVTKGATYYHANYVNPGWRLQRVNVIGRHIFYKSSKDKIDRRKEII
jgi:spore germination cell wall hydrolase CwlJ-like protein